MQLHLSYVAPAASALVWGLVGLAVTIVRARREAASGAGEGTAPGTAPRLRRNVLLAAAASLACWIGPIVDEVVHRPGNLELLVRAALHAHDPGAGIAGGVRDLTRGIGLHPLWLRSFDGLIVPQLVVTWGASLGQQWSCSRCSSASPCRPSAAHRSTQVSAAGHVLGRAGRRVLLGGQRLRGGGPPGPGRRTYRVDPDRHVRLDGARVRAR